MQPTTITPTSRGSCAPQKLPIKYYYFRWASRLSLTGHKINAKYANKGIALLSAKNVTLTSRNVTLTSSYAYILAPSFLTGIGVAERSKASKKIYHPNKTKK